MARNATLVCVLAALALLEQARGHQAVRTDLEGAQKINGTKNF